MKQRDRLRVGDWILDSGVSVKDGKFIIARVSGIIFDNWEELDLKEGKIKILGKEGKSTTEKGYYRVINERELRGIQILRTKLKTINALQDEAKIKFRR